MQFTKMHGAGNDYAYLDCITGPVPDELPELARQMSDRHFGIGADGLILIHPSDCADARMQMFNADGSEAEMCGNGIRCVAKYVYDHGHCQQQQLQIETAAGVLALELTLTNEKVSQVRVDMGKPILVADQIPTTFAGSPVVNQPLSIAGHELEVTCVSMGNPHCIVFVEELTDELVLQVGPQIEVDPHFPQRRERYPR